MINFLSQKLFDIKKYTVCHAIIILQNKIAYYMKTLTKSYLIKKSSNPFKL